MLNSQPIKEKLASIIGGPFRKNVLKIAGGTVIGQGLFFLASPILTRLYDPAAFGRFAVYAAILSILIVCGSLRYEIPIPIARKIREAVSLAIISALCLLLVCLVVSLGLLCGYPLLQKAVGRSEALIYCYLFPLGLLGGGAYKILNYYAIREQAYGMIARTRIAQSIGQVVVQVGAGWLKFGLAGLVLGDAIGRIMGVRYLSARIVRAIPRNCWRVSRKRLWVVARKHWAYPVLNAPSAFINMTALQLPTVLLTFWYGPAVAGLFAFSQTILGAPASLVGQAVAQVFTGEISRAGTDSPGLLPLYQSTSRKLFLVGLLPTLPWLIAGAWLIPLIFGENWRAAGLYVQLLSINFLVQFVSVPISVVLIYINRQGTVLVWDIARILITIACIGLPKYYLKGDLLAIACFSAAMVICYGALYLLGLFALRKNRRGNTVPLDEKGGFPQVSNSVN